MACLWEGLKRKLAISGSLALGTRSRTPLFWPRKRLLEHYAHACERRHEGFDLHAACGC